MSNAIDIGHGTVTMVGNRITCPRCGRWANLVDGHYTFVNGIISAFSKVSANRHDLEQFRSTVEAAKNGEISRDLLVERSAEIQNAFGQIVSLAIRSGFSLDRLLVIIGLIIALYSLQDSNETSAELLQRQDIQITLQQQAVREIGKLSQSSDINFASPDASKIGRSTFAAKPAEGPVGGSVGNRHERRKAKRLSKKLK